MGRLRTRDTEYQYKEYKRLLTEQSISGFSEGGTTDETLKEVAILEDIQNITSEHVLLRACKGAKGIKICTK